MPYAKTFEEVKKTPVVCSRNFRLREEVIEDDTPSIVDPAGYVDPNKRIEEYIKAGMRIDAWNRALFDYDNEIEGEERFDVEEFDTINDDFEDIRKGEISLSRYQESMQRMYSRFLETEGGKNEQQSEISTQADSKSDQASSET